METDINQQEILLVTGTTFSHMQLDGKDNKADSNLPESEQLKKAFWTGSLDELLPEIITNKKLFLWQIRDTGHSLQIELSEYPSREKRHSINPSYFLRTVQYN